MAHKPVGNLYPFTGASPLDPHFSTHGCSAEQSEARLEALIAANEAPSPDWKTLVQGLANTSAESLPALTEAQQIEDAAWQLVARARRANLVLTIETSRPPEYDKEMGNYTLVVETRPSMQSIRAKAERRELHDLEFERNERALEHP